MLLKTYFGIILFGNALAALNNLIGITAIGCFVYNIVAARTGGIEFEVETD